MMTRRTVRKIGSERSLAMTFMPMTDEIDEAWLDGVSTVGVTSGASVPEVLVRDVLTYLSERGYGEAETVVSAEESLLFALPTELRRDLKARSGNEPDQVRHDPSSLAAGALR